jgi:hypothetical protein
MVFIFSRIKNTNYSYNITISNTPLISISTYICGPIFLSKEAVIHVLQNMSKKQRKKERKPFS